MTTRLVEVRALVVNVQHCLNSLRPRRANEDLILLMRAQLLRKQRAVAALTSACEEARPRRSEAPRQRHVRRPRFSRPVPALRRPTRVSGSSLP